jgi:hypothetical protein
MRWQMRRTAAPITPKETPITTGHSLPVAIYPMATNMTANTTMPMTLTLLVLASTVTIPL